MPAGGCKIYKIYYRFDIGRFRVRISARRPENFPVTNSFSQSLQYVMGYYRVDHFLFDRVQFVREDNIFNTCCNTDNFD
jgi:hypothetical protein